MKLLNKYALGFFIGAFFAAMPSLGALTSVDKAEIPAQINLLKNPGFENSKSKWTNSAGSFSIATSGTSWLTGAGTAVFNASAASQTLTSEAVPVATSPVARLGGTNGYGSCFFKTTATDYKIQVYDGSNVLAERVIPATTVQQETGVYFPMPSTGNVYLRTISGSDAADIAQDNCVLGNAPLAQLNQASFVGSAYFAATTSCSWQRTSNPMGAFIADSDCPGPNVESNPGPGIIQTTDVDLPRVTVNNLPAGRYRVQIVTSCRVTAGYGTFAITDGTTTTGYAPTVVTLSAPCTLEGVFNYTTAGNRVFEIYAQQDSAANLIVEGGGVTGMRSATFSFYRYPSDSEVAMRADTVAWKIDASISGANIPLSTSTQTAYVAADATTLTLTTNSGSSGVNIACNSTNPSSGSTCAAGNEQAAISFEAPTTGDYEACVAFTHSSNANSNVEAIYTYQLVETGNTNQTIIQEGKDRINASSRTISSENTAYFPMRVCGTFYFAGIGQKTIRLMYEKSGGANNTANIMADASASDGQRDIHYTVRRLSQNYPAPFLVGGIYSSSNGQIRTETAHITATASTCAVTSQLGSWLTGSCSSPATGRYAYSVVVGVFSSAPYCQITKAVHNSQDRVGWFSLANSTSSSVEMYTGAGSSGMATLSNDTNGEYILTCSGLH